MNILNFSWILIVSLKNHVYDLIHLWFNKNNFWHHNNRETLFVKFCLSLNDLHYICSSPHICKFKSSTSSEQLVLIWIAALHRPYIHTIIKLIIYICLGTSITSLKLIINSWEQHIQAKFNGSRVTMHSLAFKNEYTS